MLLREYLINLNSCESSWGIWVNPNNCNDFRLGQFCFENGGVADDFICIGDLDSLSPYPRESKCFKDLFTSHGFLNSPYKNYQSRYNVDQIWELFCIKALDPDFQVFLDIQLEESINIEIEFQVDNFLDNELPILIQEAIEFRELKENKKKDVLSVLK